MKNKIYLLIVSAMIALVGVGCVSYPEMAGGSSQKAKVLISWSMPETVQRTDNGRTYSVQVNMNYYIIYGKYDGKDWYGVKKSENVIYSEGQTLELFLIKAMFRSNLLANTSKTIYGPIVFMHNWDLDTGKLTDYNGHSFYPGDIGTYLAAINRRIGRGR